MIDKAEIKEFAAKMGLRTDILEKDYVLGRLLAGISAHKELSESWVFKGGTCLKKCHKDIQSAEGTRTAFSPRYAVEIP